MLIFKIDYSALFSHPIFFIDIFIFVWLKLTSLVVCFDIFDCKDKFYAFSKSLFEIFIIYLQVFNVWYLVHLSKDSHLTFVP